MELYIKQIREEGIDGRSLKLLAVLSMLLDHVGAVLLPEWTFLRILGRLAFPIYCFLLVEGAEKTRNFRFYAIRMLIFAFVSEMPFDLAFYDSFFNMGHQNVFFTLFLGLMMIWFMESNIWTNEIPESMKLLMSVAVTGIVAELLNTDYGFHGIGIIFAFYFLKSMPIIKYLVVAILCVSMGWIESFAILAFIPIYLYNGKRGDQPALLQWAFYGFYPVHLIILALLNHLFHWIGSLFVS